MKSRFIIIIVLFCFSQNSISEELLIKIKEMSKEEYLSSIPKSMNDFILSSGGEVMAAPGSVMTGVQRLGDLMVINFELDYSNLESLYKKSTGNSSEDFKSFIKSDYFKENMFGENGTEKKFLVNHSCSAPIKLAALQKGITTKYVYLLDTGEYLGDFKVSINMCN